MKKNQNNKNKETKQPHPTQNKKNKKKTNKTYNTSGSLKGINYNVYTNNVVVKQIRNISETKLFSADLATIQNESYEKDCFVNHTYKILNASIFASCFHPEWNNVTVMSFYSIIII